MQAKQVRNINKKSKNQSKQYRFNARPRQVYNANTINRRLISNRSNKPQNRRFVPNRVKFTNLNLARRTIGSAPQKFQPQLNQRNSNNNRKSKDNTSQDYMKSKIRFLMNPMQAVLNQRLYSIYPSSDKVIRMTLFTQHTLTIPSGQQINLFWYPRGLGFSKVFSEIETNIENQYTVHVNAFASLWYMAGSMYTAQSHVVPLPMNTCSVQGRYRIIGSELKITNTTNAVNRGGSYIAGELTNDVSTPFYFYSNLIGERGGYLHYHAVIFENLLSVLKNPVENLASKQMYNSSDVALLRYAGLDQNAKLFSNYNEYMCSQYTNAATLFGYEYLADGLGYPTAMKDKSGVLGTNNLFKIAFNPPSSNQTYLVEQYMVYELIPAPESNLGTVAQQSNMKISNSHRKQLESMLKCTKA